MLRKTKFKGGFRKKVKEKLKKEKKFASKFIEPIVDSPIEIEPIEFDGAPYEIINKINVSYIPGGDRSVTKGLIHRGVIPPYQCVMPARNNHTVGELQGIINADSELILRLFKETKNVDDLLTQVQEGTIQVIKEFVSGLTILMVTFTESQGEKYVAISMEVLAKNGLFSTQFNIPMKHLQPKE